LRSQALFIDSKAPASAALRKQILTAKLRRAPAEMTAKPYTSRLDLSKVRQQNFLRKVGKWVTA
jgi:hypothetical protein